MCRCSLDVPSLKPQLLSMSMPLHALGFYSLRLNLGEQPSRKNWRIYPTCAAPRRSLAAPRCDGHQNAVDGRRYWFSSARASLACFLRMSSEAGYGLVAKLAWDQSGLPGDHRRYVCISKTVTAYRSAPFDITHHPISPEFACLIAPRRTSSIGVGTAACDPYKSHSRPRQRIVGSTRKRSFAPDFRHADHRLKPTRR